MSKRPDDIPLAVWEKAQKALQLAQTKARMSGKETEPLECLSRAILDERERCATVCWRRSEEHEYASKVRVGAQATWSRDYAAEALACAAEIRKGSP